ncbi:MAG: DUF1214 domain-containing protein [Desulfarculaceae bacterium]|nr:DUF1214 domain-containing protein [Desulfarculaceae bacterium]MCF8070756.1 DUF1214 domain-containing protein [Desulfarculaceae bacterium]MCF8102193.1 DUF1214 domain-containing protein [Desulfarculaceae bacterium]MCF8117008.1 DUF1214 domain-containing protein [Desulfarculaceae bacterium]
MRISLLAVLLSFALLLAAQAPARALDTVEEYIREYPNQEQVKMMRAWLQKHKKGTFSFTGLVDPKDTTVVTPQATVDYGYNWFSLSEGPAVLRVPAYDKFFSVSIFDMKHNVPAVIANPKKPLLIKRPGQKAPPGDFTVVELETDQGLVLTRMVVVDNLEQVKRLRKKLAMQGGKGDMDRDVQRFSPQTEKAAQAVIEAMVPFLNPDTAFGAKSGQVGELSLAAGVRIGQLGTPPGTVRYRTIMTDSQGRPFSGKDTYVLTVPANIVKKSGYYSITIYGKDNKLLIPNSQKRYDRTTYSSKPNPDGTYTITLSPQGDGLNGIPTGKPFYAILRAYVPVEGADLTVKVNKK